MLLITIQNLIMLIPLVKHPELAFILPFKDLRLTIIETERGFPLFTHIWNQTKDLEDNLFSGMLHGIGQFVQETLQSGNMREITLDKAILILKRSQKHPVVCVLVTTKSTKSLRNALDKFAEKFFNKFAGQFSEQVNIEKKFAPAKELVEECFSFVPVYE